jgi:hypothetical protein
LFLDISNENSNIIFLDSDSFFDVEDCDQSLTLDEDILKDRKFVHYVKSFNFSNDYNGYFNVILFQKKRLDIIF